VVGEGALPNEEEEVHQGGDTRVEEGDRRAQGGDRHQGGGAGQEEEGAGAGAQPGGEGQGPDQDRPPAGDATPAPHQTRTLPDKENKRQQHLILKCFFFLR